MTDHENALCVGVALHDLIEAIPRAFGDVGESLAAGDANLGGLAAPAH